MTSSVRVGLSERIGGGPVPPPTPVSLTLTRLHLTFTPAADCLPIKILLPLLHSVTRSPPSLTGQLSPLILRTRDFRVYLLHFETVEDFDLIWDTLKSHCSSVSQGGLERLLAFQRDENSSSDEKQKGKACWNIYNVQEEFTRMGIGSRSTAWRYSTINNDYEFCASYPPVIVVPSKISDTTLQYAVKYRSKGRIPGLVYLHWANLGSITRSSQPMVGITQAARSIQDEKLIELIFTSHNQHTASRQAFTLDESQPRVYGAQSTNIIIDARPSKNAYANSVKGAGSENMSFYKNCKKEYLGIDNIHVMRSSLNAVFDVLRESESSGYLDRNGLRKTGWLNHVTNILDGVKTITRTIHVKNSHALVHCSDGWDRTSQLSALPQICLDPFYRTGRGFAVLIEKDWISYGHKFADRSDHLCNDRVEFIQTRGDDTTAQQAFLAGVQKTFAGSSHSFKETCPVFHQFLDCVYQFQIQFPNRFEFNENLLLHLFRLTYSTEFGNFLFNSERERTEFDARNRTRSVWETILNQVENEDGTTRLVLKSEYVNPQYDPQLDDPDSRELDSDQGILDIHPQKIVWWHNLFKRTDEEMNGKPNQHVTELPPPAVAAHTTIEPGQEDSALSLKTAALDFVTSSNPWNPQSSASTTTMTSPTAPYAAPSRNNSLPLAAPSQVQLSEAVSSVQKWGWSALKSVQKYGQEAAKEAAKRYEELQKEREAGTAVALGQGSNSSPNGSIDQIEPRAKTEPAPYVRKNPWATQQTSHAPINSFETPPQSPNRSKPANPISHPGAIALNSPEKTDSKQNFDPLGVGL